MPDYEALLKENADLKQSYERLKQTYLLLKRAHYALVKKLARYT